MSFVPLDLKPLCLLCSETFSGEIISQRFFGKNSGLLAWIGMLVKNDTAAIPVIGEFKEKTTTMFSVLLS